jgi:hypothetical protein
MNRVKGSIAAATLGLSLLASPAQACWTNVEQDAARIANLNQMMMVSALRCRFGKHNFLADYNRFIRNNNDVLASQHRVIQDHYAKTSGSKASFAELDKFMIGLSNYYGGGHGNPDCGALEKLSHHLSKGRHDVETLASLAESQVGVPRQAAQACSVNIAARR